jgi:hypothetical protein
MTDRFNPVPKKERKKILLLCDDIRMHSGIATMAREFVLGTAHHFNWFNVGAAVKHGEKGKILDISEDINKTIGDIDSDVKILPYDGYGDSTLVRQLLDKEQPDAIFIFTDPRYWVWLFEIEREVRNKIPIIWLNIWDDYPAPKYNENYYNSVDALLAISQQTKVINEMVLGDDIKNKVAEYIPHGINHNIFKPIENKDTNSEFINFKKGVFGDKDYEFVVFFNSRNIHRKRPGDVILSYRLFCDLIGKEKAKKCALVMHTQAIDPNGTDLTAVKSALCPSEYVNVYFSQSKITPAQMNGLYNLADLTVLISSNEGWGLSLTESMMAGTMIAANVTGGMQDQMRFEDENGDWVKLTKEFPSNHRGTYKKSGDWAIPIFPNNISLAGSPPTPYIFDDRCSPEDIAEAIKVAYETPKEERVRKGLAGREWATSSESKFSGVEMSNSIQKAINKTIEEFEPRPTFDLIKVEERPSKLVEHKLVGY